MNYSMVFCKECCHEIPNDSPYFIIPEKGIFLCSQECREKYAKKEQEKEDKDFLWELIKRIFNVAKPTPQMLAEIKRFKNKDGISYRNQALILRYIYYVKNKPVYGSSLYLIGQTKDEAADYYRNVKEKDLESLQKERENNFAPRSITPTYGMDQKRRTTVQIIDPKDV